MALLYRGGGPRTRSAPGPGGTAMTLLFSHPRGPRSRTPTNPFRLPLLRGPDSRWVVDPTGWGMSSLLLEVEDVELEFRMLRVTGSPSSSSFVTPGHRGAEPPSDERAGPHPWSLRVDRRRRPAATIERWGYGRQHLDHAGHAGVGSGSIFLYCTDPDGVWIEPTRSSVRATVQAKRHIGNFPVVLGNPDKSSVGQETKALQQVLRQLQLEIGAEVRAQGAER